MPTPSPVPLPHPLTGELFPSPVPAGTGWPEDPAPAGTRVARSAAGVRRLAATADLGEVEARVSVCAACPRLVRWREDAAREKRASFADQPYWGRPIPGWGDPEPQILVVGLAPAAHGGNRTGRVFTGDPSGDWLFASLHRVGLAIQETSRHAGDGQRLVGTRMVARVRCAPPENKPTPAERDACAPWIQREVALLLPTVRVVVALGAFGWGGALEALDGAGVAVPHPGPKFGHGVEVEMSGPAGPVTLVGCFHPSPHNTYTRRLTAEMTDEVFLRARALADLGTSS
ncbi:uracil-DNA glycosylase [Nocardioides malaquae]|uniref:uracil-DNA glycosylase n=1 Tax=Nocardioides malaquae TaxID=2773426 RepID=UPI0029D415E2|nr:uracil-DNA glycosylase [Nocardioides malaquae]